MVDKTAAPPTSLGVVYPMGYVVAVIDDPAQAAEALCQNGTPDDDIKLLTGGEVIAVDASGLGTQSGRCRKGHAVLPTRSSLRGLQHCAYLTPPLHEEPSLVYEGDDCLVGVVAIPEVVAQFVMGRTEAALFSLETRRPA